MLQTYRTAPRTNQGRANRIRQPQIREERKAPTPKNVVLMLDGTRCAVKGFNDMRSIAHKKLREDFSGIATRVRLAITEHEGAWDTIMEWVNTHRPKYGDIGHQNDTLVATAIVYAANRYRRTAAEIVRDIMRTRSAKVLLPATTQ